MKNNNKEEKLLFGATSIFGVMTIVALVVTIVFARTLGAYVSGGITVLILGIVTYVLFGRLGLGDDKAEAKAEAKSDKKDEAAEAKTEVAPAPAAAEVPANPSGFDEAVLSRAQGYFGEAYAKGIASQKEKVLREVDAGFNKGLKDAVDEYETACGKKLDVFTVNFKPKASKGGGDADAK